MKEEKMTTAELFLEAVVLVAAILYMGLQIYYGIAYGTGAVKIIMNVAAMILVYAGLTLLGIYPERVNGLSRDVCSGPVRKYTVRMVRFVKLIFVSGILFTSVCDVMGHELNAGYSLVVVVAIVITVGIYEGKIIRILRQNRDKK